MKILLYSVLLSLHSFAADIPIVALDASGVETGGSISRADFKKSVRFALAKSNEIANQQIQVADHQFVLEQINVGFGASGEIGIGPFAIGAGVRHRYIFKRKVD